MSSLQYTSELLDAVLFSAGEITTDGSSDFESHALRMLNRAYRAVCNGGSDLDPSVREDWWFLHKTPPGVLTLLPAVSAGTATVTHNSTSVTLSTGPALDMDGYFFQVLTHSDVFRVSAHTAGGTAVTLDSVYTGPSGSGLAYRLVKLEYDLASDVIRLHKPMRCYRPTGYTLDNYEIRGMDLSDMERDYPVAVVEAGTPDRFAPVGETKVRFNRYGGTASTDLIRVEYDYIYRPAELTNSGSQEPVLPLERRTILVDYALSLLMDDKDDDRSTGRLELARRGLLSMQLDNRHRMAFQNPNAGRVIPRGATTRTRPVRTSSGLIIG